MNQGGRGRLVYRTPPKSFPALTTSPPRSVRLSAPVPLPSPLVALGVVLGFPVVVMLLLVVVAWWWSWREFPCFHADLPGFRFCFFCVRHQVFFRPHGRIFFSGPFLAPKPFFHRKNGVLAQKRVLRRVLRSPRGFFGSSFSMPALSKKGNSRHDAAFGAGW